MKQYVVDAFTDQLFHGNQAAVCVLNHWLEDDMMINIAIENNFSETAFTVKEKEGYRLRWFTPGGEIKLCGHATLATSYVLFHYYEKEKTELVFHTLSGDLKVSKEDDYLVMTFPKLEYQETKVTDLMEEAFKLKPSKAFVGDRLLLIYNDEQIIRDMKPDFDKVALLNDHGVIVSAHGKHYDCVSRFFAPRLKINEDPVTGSAHCMLVPYWANELGKNDINAYQASKRGGELLCKLTDHQVIIKGKAVLYCIGELNIKA